MERLVRLAVLDDAAGIAEVYNQGIEDRKATFETRLRSTDDIRDLLQARGHSYPTVVALSVNDRIDAFAWVSQYRPRDCYAGIGDFGVYVHRRARGQGLGRDVMELLMDECRDRGFWKLVGRIFPENAASRGLCRSLGLREVGVYERHGRLDGVWRDNIIVEKLLVDP
jgi:L-amino acid N-acyltransferase YncA